MPITDLENNSEYVLVEVFANKPSHYVASWYRPVGGFLEKPESQLIVSHSKVSLKRSRICIKATKPPQSMFLGTLTLVILFGKPDSTNLVLL